VNDDGSYVHIRRIVIGECNKIRSKSNSKHSIESDQSDDLELPDHNLSSSVVIKSLKDGNFSAEISLRDLPSGDLTLYVHGHELDIFLERSHLQDRKHRISHPQHYGVVHLPIFVDEKSLLFAQDALKDVLFIDGRTKFYFSRRRSLSHGTLHTVGLKDNGRNFWKVVSEKFGLKRAHSHECVEQSGLIVTKINTRGRDLS
jgi:hypothetical protein